MANKNKGEKLLECGFSMYGIGNFNLSTKEMSLIISLVEQGDFKSIKELYESLSQERLG